MEPTVTEREAVERERLAFQQGICHAEMMAFNGGQREDARFIRESFKWGAAAAERYPLPRVTRPREVKDEYGFEWRMMKNNVEWRPQGNLQWSEKLTDQGYSLTITRGRATLIADLLANPTETVDG